MDITPRTFQTLDGQIIRIGGKQSKPTLINLWFIACPGCVAEMPALNRLQEKYADKVNFLALTFDKKESVNNFLLKKSFNFKHITNCRDFINKIGSKPYPENIFVDRNGTIRYIEGGLPPSENLDLVIKHFESILEELLQPTRVLK
jgi:thiol-disulfide isomerase/thioredoxin